MQKPDLPKGGSPPNFRSLKSGRGVAAKERAALLPVKDKRDMKIQIKSTIGSVLFEGDFRSVAEAVKAAVKSSADLSSAKGSELAIAMTRILPEGDIIGWKKCREEKIVKLLVPAASKRSHAFGRKCRAEFATVLEIIGGGKTAESYREDGFTYKVGETVRPKEKFNEDWTEECTSGIHFYITKIEAENHT